MPGARHEIDRTDRRHRRNVDGVAVGRPGRRCHQLAQFKLHDRPAAVDYSRCDPHGDRPCPDCGLARAQVTAVRSGFRPVADIRKLFSSHVSRVRGAHAFPSSKTVARLARVRR
jgi:hypothetical protein